MVVYFFFIGYLGFFFLIFSVCIRLAFWSFFFFSTFFIFLLSTYACHGRHFFNEGRYRRDTSSGFFFLGYFRD